MNGEKRLCYSCMAMVPKDIEVCPCCGFAEEAYEPNPRSLPLKTLLHNRYVVGKVIGEGGFGITYIGWDKLNETPVAIKEYFPINVASRDCTHGGSTYVYFYNKKDENLYKNGFDKYTHEAQVLQQFGDLDGIVSIRDFFHENNTAYIVMEYVEGITLKEYLQTNGTLSPTETIELMMPVLLALEKIHEKGVIHRDISPDNIMIRVDGAFKLIDFGAARLTNDESGKSLTIILKRGYAPEEQYRTKGKQGPWTDVYALCATMYKMMTDHILPEAMDRLVDDEHIPLQDFHLDITKAQCEAIEKGLRVRGSDRFQSVRDLRLALTTEQNKVKDLHMIATFQERDGKIIGYRLYDTNNNKVIDIEPEQLLRDIKSAKYAVNNLIVYQNYIQPVGGSLKNYPVLDLLEHLNANDNYYYVSHSLAKGYYCLNYKGIRSFYNEMEMQHLMENGRIANEEKLKLFIALRDKHAKEYIPAEHQHTTMQIPQKPISVSEELREERESKKEPEHVKLSLKTAQDNVFVSNGSDNLTKDVGTQMRLRMAQKTHLSDIAEKKEKKKKGFFF